MDQADTVCHKDFVENMSECISAVKRPTQAEVSRLARRPQSRRLWSWATLFAGRQASISADESLASEHFSKLTTDRKKRSKQLVLGLVSTIDAEMSWDVEQSSERVAWLDGAVVG